MRFLKNIIYIFICLPVIGQAQTKSTNTKTPNWANELKNVLPKVFAIATKADEPVNKLIAKRSGEDFATTINLPGSKLTYVSKGNTRWENGKGHTWWSWVALVDTAIKGTESERLSNSFSKLRNELKTILAGKEMSASNQSEISAKYYLGNDCYVYADIVKGITSYTKDFVQLLVIFSRESNVDHKKLVDSVKQIMSTLVNNNQLTSKEIAAKIIKESKILESEQVNPTSISELAVEIFSLAASKNMDIAFELYVQWPEEKDLEKMKVKLSSSQREQFKVLAQRVVDNHNNKSTPPNPVITVQKKPDVQAYDPAKDASCVFKAGAFLRYKETLTHPSSSGLDAYVVSCKDGYYRIVTRKYVPGEKTWFIQNKNIPHYMLSETSQTRGYMEREYVLNEDYKAGKKITVCAQCRGIGAEYYAEKTVNGKTESVNVTHIISTLSSNVKITKSGCSKCYGAGWKVEN